jgi:hypothetical protein
MALFFEWTRISANEPFSLVRLGQILVSIVLLFLAKESLRIQRNGGTLIIFDLSFLP